MTKGRMGRVVAGLGVLALVLAGPAPAADSAGEIPLPDNPLEGRVLFAKRHCNQCHGIAGSSPGIGANLGEGHFSGTFLELGAALWNHVPGMSVTVEVTGMDWPALSEAETAELIVFLNFMDYLGRPGRAAEGERLFADKGCSACHAVSGGESHRGPDLADLTSFASPLFVAQQIWNHGPSMFASMREAGMRPPSFEDGDLADISAYIRQKAPPGPRERMLLAPGNPNHGAELFADKGCASCHGADGKSGSYGPNLGQADLHRSAEGIAGTMWNHALAMSATMRQRGIGWPEFEGSEMADLVAFLYFLPFEDVAGRAVGGEAVFAANACSECHGADGQGDQATGLVGIEATATPAALVSAMWNHAPTMKSAILREGRPWPELTGEDLRDLLAFFAAK